MHSDLINWSHSHTFFVVHFEPIIYDSISEVQKTISKMNRHTERQSGNLFVNSAQRMLIFSQGGVKQMERSICEMHVVTKDRMVVAYADGNSLLSFCFYFALIPRINVSQ